MKIIVASHAGFCYGVKRAVDGAKEVLKNSQENVYCLGEIVHNQDVINELEKSGLIMINHIQETKGKTIIRAHGAPKEVYDYVKQNHIEIEDYTCPNVMKIHELVKEYAQKGYYIILVGNSKHPEIIATESFCGKNYSIIENENDVEKVAVFLKESNHHHILLITQTTYSVSVFQSCKEKLQRLLSKDIDLVVKNTICNATEIRQKEAEKLSQRVDMMIVIGGKNSSNTRKLYEICVKNCPNTLLIENEEEMQETMTSFHVIGIVAGASTPKESIEKVITKLNQG